MSLLPSKEWARPDGAILSADERYRWVLWRTVGSDGDGTCTFVLLNPSTADAKQDDATVRKCCAFARRRHYIAMAIVNLFAWRAKDPKELARVHREGGDIVGPDNDAYIDEVIGRSKIVICGWGIQGKLLDRGAIVQRRLALRARALHVNADGSPGHPLYLPGNLMPMPYGWTR